VRLFADPTLTPALFGLATAEAIPRNQASMTSSVRLSGN
jgi:hypothetical protein